MIQMLVMLCGMAFMGMLIYSLSMQVEIPLYIIILAPLSFCGTVMAIAKSTRR